MINSIDTVFPYLPCVLACKRNTLLRLCLKTAFLFSVSCILRTEKRHVFFLKLMKPCKCIGLADYYCYCKFTSILPLQNLACSVILYLFGIGIMLWFVPVKSLAYVVTKITVHVSGLKYWERKKQGR